MKRPVEIIAIWLLFLGALTGYGAAFVWNAIENPERSVPFGVLWHHLKYFTHWTNILLIFLSGAMVFRRRYISDSFLAAITLWMSVVFAVWHGLLADGQARQGLDFYSNAMGHTVNPILLFLIWVLFAPKNALTWRDPFYWLIWPLVYVSAAVLRGQISGFYPYFFLNISELGWAGFAGWVAGFLVTFLIGGFVFVFIGRSLARRQKT